MADKGFWCRLGRPPLDYLLRPARLKVPTVERLRPGCKRASVSFSLSKPRPGVIRAPTVRPKRLARFAGAGQLAPRRHRALFELPAPRFALRQLLQPSPPLPLPLAHLPVAHRPMNARSVPTRFAHPGGQIQRPLGKRRPSALIRERRAGNHREGRGGGLGGWRGGRVRFLGLHRPLVGLAVVPISAVGNS